MEVPFVPTSCRARWWFRDNSRYADAGFVPAAVPDSSAGGGETSRAPPHARSPLRQRGALDERGRTSHVIAATSDTRP